MKFNLQYNEIVALNHSWKAAVELFGDDSPLSQNARDLKGCLQVRLLQSYPDQVYLIIDKETSETAGEELYSFRFKPLLPCPYYINRSQELTASRHDQRHHHSAIHRRGFYP